MTKLLEYVYISDKKLKGFIPEDPKWWQRGRIRNVHGHAEAGVSQAKASIDADLALTDKLIEEASPFATSLKVARVAKALEGGLATSMDDPGVRAGDWIFFDGWIGCHVVDIEPKPGAVLFAELPNARGRSVLLHGSAIHLEDRRQATDVPQTVPMPFSAREEAPSIIRRAGVGPADAFSQVLHGLKGDRRGAVTLAELVGDIADFYATVVKTDWFKRSAPFLAGFARVTAIVPLPDGTEVVIGSPLFVRYARPE
jgi:hypothetical protein